MPGLSMPSIRLRFALTVTLVATFAFPVAGAQFGVHPDGSKAEALAARGTRAVALFFVASDCPISDRTFPEMKRLRESFAPRGVKVLFVYPNTTEDLAKVTAHQNAFDPGGEILLDPHGDLVRLTRARVTPEVSVLVPDGAGWRPVYTGRVDDRFIHLGLERPHATQLFGEEAVNAVLSGTAVPKATGVPVGCGIVNPAVDGARGNR